MNSSKNLSTMENSNNGNSVMRIVTKIPCLSVVQTNATVHASTGKEQRANLVDNQKVNQHKSSIPKIDKGRSQARLLQENKLAAKGMNLTYILPVIKDGEVVVQLMDEDIEEEKLKWTS